MPDCNLHKAASLAEKQGRCALVWQGYGCFTGFLSLIRLIHIQRTKFPDSQLNSATPTSRSDTN